MNEEANKVGKYQPDLTEYVKSLEDRLFKIENFSDGERNMLTSYIRSLEARIAKLEGKSEIPTNPEESTDGALTSCACCAGTGKTKFHISNAQFFDKALDTAKLEELKKVRPRVEYSEKYWFRNHCGDPDCWHEIGADYNNYQYNTGNYFLTEAECEAYCAETNAKALALQRIKDWMMAKGYEFESQWNLGEFKLYYNHEEKRWKVSETWRNQGVGECFYFSEKPHAEQCISECEKDLNILIGLK